MSSSRYINLTVAAILAASSLVFVIATVSIGYVSAESKTSGPILKSKILRRNNQRKVKLSGNELAELRSHASPQEERKFEDEIPKHLPIKFKLKAEKEKKFKDLGNPGWYRDFELEVTNTSDKPIYFLELWLVYPEIESGIGAPLGVPLRYGRMNFIYQETLPLPTDVPIQPGETYVFTIPEKARVGWEEHKSADKIPDPKKVVLKFVQLSFGDGTGFDGTDAKPYPYKKEKSVVVPCREGPRQIVAEGGFVNARSPTLDASLRNQSILPITGGLSAGYFSADNSGYAFLGNSSSDPDLCCGSGCYFMRPIMESCNCGSSRGNSYPGCSDSGAACGIPVIIGTFCPGLGVGCPEFTRGVCVTDAPPPPSPAPASPTSTPTPSPSPSPSPLFSPCPSPRSLSTCASGWTAIWLSTLCRWQCLPPEPGGGGATYRTEYYIDTAFHYAYYDECTVHVWVTYVSYDGGETWEETGEVEYAGCW